MTFPYRGIYEPLPDSDDFDFDDAQRAAKMLGGCLLYALTLFFIGLAFTFWEWSK